MKEIKTVPYVPLSHPFVERLIGTIRRECLDRTLFWTTADLEMKLLDFQRYYNEHRTHAGLDGRTPDPSETLRLKMIKRQMYGRAGFELLGARVLPRESADALEDNCTESA